MPRKPLYMGLMLVLVRKQVGGSHSQVTTGKPPYAQAWGTPCQEDRGINHLFSTLSI